MTNRKGIISLIAVLIILVAFLALLNIYQIRGGRLQKANIYTARENMEAEEEKFYTHPKKLTNQEIASLGIADEEKERPSGLNKNIKDVVFSKDGRKIAYHYFAGPDNGNISISNPDGSNFKIILKTRVQKLELFWPNNNTLSFYNLDEPADLFSLGISSQELLKITGPLYNFSAQWAPDGKTVIYSGSVSPNAEVKLFWHNPKEQTYVDLELSALASGCAWSVDNNTIFCSDKSGFWKVDIKNQTKENIYQNPAYLAQKIILPPLENYLVFKNKDGLIYSLPLKD